MASSASPDEVELTTVGIDIGSATSHLLLSKVLLRRRADRLINRFTVVRRQQLYASPVTLTPYSRGEVIDQHALRTFVDAQYESAGLTAREIDTGAVVLTGTALLRRNARAVADVIAAHSGRLVAASAGHHFEAVLSAHGSGAVARSKGGRRVLNVDIGGGTTKLTLAADGQVFDTAVLAVGSRLVTWDEQRFVTQVHHTLAPLSPRPALVVGEKISQAAEAELAAAMVAQVGAFATGQRRGCQVGVPLAPRLDDWSADDVVFSGGVAEYVYSREDRNFGDLGFAIGTAMRAQSRAWQWGEQLENTAGIRATVVGAGQYSAQVSGSTIYVGTPHPLPLTGLPVVRVPVSAELSAVELAANMVAELARHADHCKGMPALALSWPYPPEYPALRRLAEGIARVSVSAPQLVVAVQQDIAHTLGRMLTEELAWQGRLVCVDGIDVDDFDFLDIGEPLQPSGVVPVVVRSLLFPDQNHVPDQHEPVDNALATNAEGGSR